MPSRQHDTPKTLLCIESFATSDEDGRPIIVGQGQMYPSDHPMVKLSPDRFVEVSQPDEN